MNARSNIWLIVPGGLDDKLLSPQSLTVFVVFTFVLQVSFFCKAIIHHKSHTVRQIHYVIISATPTIQCDEEWKSVSAI